LGRGVLFSPKEGATGAPQKAVGVHGGEVVVGFVWVEMMILGQEKPDVFLRMRWLRFFRPMSPSYFSDSGIAFLSLFRFL